MAQLYFLSIVFNFLASLILIIDGKKLETNGAGVTGFNDMTDEDADIGEEKGPGKGKKIFNFQDIAENKAFHFFIGTVTFIIGVFKLLASYDGIMIIGDLLPAIAGIILGGMLFVDYFKSTTAISSEIINKLDEIFIKNKKYIGTAGIAIAITHFIFPQIILL